MPATSTRSSGITAVGAVIAFGTGLALGAGAALLEDASPNKVAKKACGGALCMFGLYLAVPAAVRNVWLAP